MIKRRLKIAALTLGLFLLLVLSFLGWIIYTEAGLQFAVTHLPEKLGKVTLHIEDVRGTIAGGFRAARVDVDHERSHVHIENASARVNFWPLLVGRISVRRADAELVQVEVRRRVRPPPDTPPKFMPRLLSISAERATAKSLVIIAPNGKHVVFNEVNGAGIVGHKTIRIYEGNAIYGVLHARAIGVLRADNPIKLSGESTTRMIIEGQPEWLAQASFDGDLAKLPVTGKLQAPFRADMRGELLELNTNFHWQGKATVHNFDLRAFGAGGALGIVSGTLDVGGEMNAFHARGPLLVPGLGEGLFDMVFEGNYADDKVNATHYETTHRATGSHVDGAGTIEVVENGPKLDLAGNWSELRWPLQQRFTAEKPQIFSSPAGSYTLAGVWPYALTARGELYVPQIEPMTVAMRGALHKDHLDVDELDLGAFGGQARLAGNARWTPDESWALEGDVKGLDPATLRRGFGGALDFHMKASGAPFGGDNLDFAFANLSGQLRGSPASGGGRIIMQGEDWTFRSLRLRAGTTRLAMDGQLGPTRPLNLDFSIDADNLGLIAEGARGTLHADGTVAGSSGAPVIRLNAQGAHIEHEGVEVAKLAANIDVDWRGQRDSHADVAISGLKVDERELTQFNVVLDGTTADHAFKMDALASHTSLHLSGKGAFTNKVWNATIGDLFIDDTANINLRLDAPFQVTASAVGRYFFGTPGRLIEELSGLLMIALLFTALAVPGREGHIRAGLVADRVKEPLRTVFRVVALAILLLFAIIFAWEAGEQTLFNFQRNIRTELGGLAIWPWSLIMAAALVILAAGQAVNVFTGPVGYLLMMTGRESLMRNTIMGSTLLNVALNAALIPSLGAIGAAVATATSLAVMNICSAVLVRRELSILTLPLPSRAPAHV